MNDRLPDCRCGHSAYVHTIPEGKQERTSCSTRYGGKCPCRKYVPGAPVRGDVPRCDKCQELAT